MPDLTKDERDLLRTICDNWPDQARGRCQHDTPRALKGLKMVRQPAPVSQYQIELLSRAKARIARSRVQYGDKIAYPDDMQLMLDLVAQIESLTSALEMNGSLAAHNKCPSCSRMFVDGETCPRGGCPMGGDV